MSRILTAEHIRKSFGNHTVLKDINLNVEKGDVVSILGPSGTGKTTFLRCLNYLEQPDSGKLTIDDVSVDFSKISKDEVKRLRRKSTMVFQQFNLFRNKNVLENITEGLIYGYGKSASEAKDIAMEELKRVHMEDYAKMYPSELSGGMQQRAAIARALAYEPTFILMDEPFGHLDAQTRYMMQESIEEIWEKEKRTVVFVTNNIEEALYLADRIILLSDCPSQIRAEYKIDLPRPRDLVSPEFMRLRKEITERMNSAVY